MPIALKVSPLVRAAAATIHARFFRLRPAASPVALASQEAFQFSFQALFETASRQVKDQVAHVLDQLEDKFIRTALRHLQRKVAYGYNSHGLISCRLLVWRLHSTG
jgi:hypothetical protein